MRPTKSKTAVVAEEVGGTAVRCDVTSESDVAALAGLVGDRLDVLVNNAGGAFGADPVAEADPDGWRRSYEVNVIGLLPVTKALLPALVASGADAVYAGVAEPLVAEDVADAITWMVARPPHVNVDEMVIRPRAQAAQHKVHRVL